MKITWRKLNTAVPFMVIVIGFALIYSRLMTGGERGKVSQAYNRATNCFAATSPTKRTAKYVRACYDAAERDAGVSVGTIIRYGDGR